MQSAHIVFEPERLLVSGGGQWFTDGASIDGKILSTPFAVPRAHVKEMGAA
jgi:hypothetical protein